MVQIVFKDFLRKLLATDSGMIPISYMPKIVINLLGCYQATTRQSTLFEIPAKFSFLRRLR
jgi:hypothetical protein